MSQQRSVWSAISQLREGTSALHKRSDGDTSRLIGGEKRDGLSRLDISWY